MIAKRWVVSASTAMLMVVSSLVSPFMANGAQAVATFAASVQGPSSVFLGSQASFNLSVVDSGDALSGAVVDLEITNSSNQRVFQKFFTGQNFSANQTLAYSAAWTPSAGGTYTVKVGVFTSNWANLIAWNNTAGQFTVSNPPTVTFSGLGSMNSSLTVGTQATLNGSVTDSGNGSASNAVVMLEVANSAGTNVYQQVFYNQNFTPGETQNYTAQWTPNATGDYTLNIGVFKGDWSSLLGWMSAVSKTTVNPQPAPVAVSTNVAGVNLSAGVNTNSNGSLYVDPNSSAAVAARSASASDAALLNVIAGQPVAAWFGDWNANVYNDVNGLVTAAANQGKTPVLVAYNIPERDCGGYSSGGATSADAYRSWIQAFANGIGSRKAIVILEPDALADIGCLSSADQATRLSLLGSAVNTLKSLGNTSVYLDAGNPNWISPSIMAGRLKSANVSAANGFALNVSNFYTTASNEQYGQAVSSLIGGKHFVIDTGRNGNGAPSDGSWCNPSGRALGSFPTFTTGNASVDAFLWIKTPGESDGQCNGGPSAGTFWAQYAEQLVQNAGL